MSALADYIDASIGRKPLSLLIKNCKLLNVFTGEIYSTSIGIYKDKIVLVDDAPNRSEVENVKALPLRLKFFAPTCVTESGAVTAGDEITPEDIEDMLFWEGNCGLGEVMDFPAVLSGASKMMQILELGRKTNSVIDGHSPLLTGAELNAYITSGAEADHENFTVETALEKMRLGMYVKLRGPYLLDTKKFVSAIEKLPRPWNLIFCTDDVMPDNLERWGHLD